MIVALFSRDNVTINDLDIMCFSDLQYWYDAHIEITKALKKTPPKPSKK